MTLDLFIDLLLSTGILFLACLSLFARHLFTGIVLYVSLGLLVALAWARLGAWDVAIAEAAIGAGLTGTLLLTAWKKLRSKSCPGGQADVS